MKNTFNTKSSFATALSRCGRVLSLIAIGLMLASTASAGYYLRYNVTSNSNNYSSSDYQWTTDAVEPVGDVCTWTISCRQYENYFYLSTAQNVSNIVSLDNTGAITNNASSVDVANKNNDFGQKKYLYIHTTQACTLTISIGVGTGHPVTITEGSSPTPTGDALPVLSTTNMAGDLLHIFIDGLGTDYYNTDTWTIEGTNVPSGVTFTRYNADAGGEIMYAVANYTSLTGEYTFTLTDVTESKCAKVTMNGTAYSSHTACTTSYTNTNATVRAGSLPVVTKTVNAVVSAYLAKLGCYNGDYAEVETITAYFAKSTPTLESEKIQLQKTSVAGGAFSAETPYDLTIISSKLNALTGSGEVIHVRFTATNDNGESDLSDEICFKWEACPTITGAVETTQYKPETYSIKDAATWSVSTNPSNAGYLQPTDCGTESTTDVVFKAPTGTYVLKAEGGGCESYKTITVSADSETCGE